MSLQWILGILSASILNPFSIWSINRAEELSYLSRFTYQVAVSTYTLQAQVCTYKQINSTFYPNLESHLLGSQLVVSCCLQRLNVLHSFLQSSPSLCIPQYSLSLCRNRSNAFRLSHLSASVCVSVFCAKGFLAGYCIGVVASPVRGSGSWENIIYRPLAQWRGDQMSRRHHPSDSEPERPA